MKNIMNIVIRKNKQHLRFYVEGKKLPFQAVLDYRKQHKVVLYRVQTFEGEQKLVDCYIPFQNESQFRSRLIKAAKAKV